MFLLCECIPCWVYRLLLGQCPRHGLSPVLDQNDFCMKKKKCNIGLGIVSPNVLDSGVSDFLIVIHSYLFNR